MKHGRSIITMSAAVLLTLCAASTTYATPQGAEKSGDRTDTITVPEMQCGMCESRIEKAVKGLKGITSVSADAEANRVIVTYNPKSVSRSTIEKSIAEVGYDAGETPTTTTAQAKLPGCCRPGAHD